MATKQGDTVVKMRVLVVTSATLIGPWRLSRSRARIFQESASIVAKWNLVICSLRCLVIPGPDFTPRAQMTEMGMSS